VPSVDIPKGVRKEVGIMRNARLLLIWLVVIAVPSALGTASASATACGKSKTQWVLCSAAGEEITETGIEGNGGKVTLKTATLTLQCATTKSLKTKYIIGIPIVSEEEVNECSVTKPSSCTVANPLKTNELKGELINTPPTTPEEQLKGTGEKEEYMTITIEGKECALAGKRTLTGRQNCKLDATFETAQESHELICAASGSKLKLGSEAAEFEGTIKHHITSKATWSVKSN
jgi:hypothetical protein